METTKIDLPIIDAYVTTRKSPHPPTPPVMYERPQQVNGTTYKVKPPNLGCALYITINNIDLPDGTMRPFEIFVSSKNVKNHQWITALTRMMSAVFRKPGSLDFVVEELMQVFDPQGGYWEKGTMIPSEVAHIGLVLKQHMEALGATPDMDPALRRMVEAKKKEVEERGIEDSAMFCTDCGAQAVYHLDGCAVCVECAASNCS